MSYPKKILHNERFHRKFKVMILLFVSVEILDQLHEYYACHKRFSL